MVAESLLPARHRTAMWMREFFPRYISPGTQSRFHISWFQGDTELGVHIAPGETNHLSVLENLGGQGVDGEDCTC
jgi:hypothetical protein